MKNPKIVHKMAQKSSKDFKPSIHNIVSVQKWTLLKLYMAFSMPTELPTPETQ